MKFDDIKKLHQKKYRKEFKYFLIEGEHLILELEKACAKYPKLLESQIYCTEKYQDFKTRLKTHLLNEKQLAQISETKTPQGIIACVPLDFNLETEFEKSTKAIYLQEIQDPGNLGTILRSLAWFGGYKLLLSPNSVDPFNSKVIRASMGAIFHVAIAQDVEIEQLKQNHKKFACLGMKGLSIKSKEFEEFDCYLFGNEARGLDHATIQQLNPSEFTILGAQTIDSLNLATAVSLSCYQLQK